MILALNMPPEIPVWIPVLGILCNHRCKNSFTVVWDRTS